MQRARLQFSRFDPQLHAAEHLPVVRDLVARTWGDPGSLPETWLKLADQAFTARDASGQLVGVTLMRRIGPDWLWSIAAVTADDERRSGVTMRLNAMGLARSWGARLRSTPGRALQPLQLCFRTANPRIYRLLARRWPVYPRVNGGPPNEEQLRILRRVHALSGGQPPDEERFVLPGVYREYPALIPRPDAVPWSGDPAIDRFFRERVRPGDPSGDMLFVIATMRPLSIPWHVLKKRLRAARARAA